MFHVAVHAGPGIVREIREPVRVVEGVAADLGEKARHMVEESFSQEGIYAQCAGYGNDAFPPSSLVRVHFPYSADQRIVRPEDALNPAICDITLAEKVLRVAMLLENVNVMFGLGSLSTAHTEADLSIVSDAIHHAAQRLKPALSWRSPMRPPE